MLWAFIAHHDAEGVEAVRRHGARDCLRLFTARRSIFLAPLPPVDSAAHLVDESGDDLKIHWPGAGNDVVVVGARHHL